MTYTWIKRVLLAVILFLFLWYLVANTFGGSITGRNYPNKLGMAVQNLASLSTALTTGGKERMTISWGINKRLSFIPEKIPLLVDAEQQEIHIIHLTPRQTESLSSQATVRISSQGQSYDQALASLGPWLVINWGRKKLFLTDHYTLADLVDLYRAKTDATPRPDPRP